VDAETDWNALKKSHPWLLKEKLVVKPDQLFGKRGKHHLVRLNASFDDCRAFVSGRLGKEIEVGKARGTLTHFLIEPFVPHDEEYYLAFRTLNDADEILFSLRGGVDVEANWENVISLRVPILRSLQENALSEKLLSSVPSERRGPLASFIASLYRAFADLDFAYLEFNPLAWSKNGPELLDAVARLDDTAAFQHVEDWKTISFPTPFGRTMKKEEAFIASLDAKTGASLKLTVLNPEGSVWLLVAGGGASVIYTDTVADMGFGDQLGNYGEYSGDPNEELTYLYAKTVLQLVTRSPAKKKSVIIGGGIANFTDVAKTFKGIVRALTEDAEAIRKAHVKLFVRRGGPNYPEGLKRMKETGETLKIPIEVYGPEMHMTSVVPKAIDWVRS